MPFCPHCGAEVFETDAFCKACGTSLLSGRRAPLRRQPDAEPADPGPGAAAKPSDDGPPVDDRYPALRMRRLRRAGSRHHTQAPPPDAGSAVPEEDMEAATLIARPKFDDIVEDPGDAAPPAGTVAPEPYRPGRRYVAEELEAPPPSRPPKGGSPFHDEPDPAPTRSRTLRDAPPFSDEGVPDDVDLLPPPARTPPPASRRRPYAGLQPQDEEDLLHRDVRHRSGLYPKAGAEERPAPPWAPGEEAEAGADDETREAIRRRYAGLDREADEPGVTTLRPRRTEPSRLTSPRRSDIQDKGVTEKYEDDALLAELARTYSREYTGREGWSPGALLDSTSYAFRLLGKKAGRTMAIRRLRRERTEREQVRQDQLTELGEVALSLRDLDTPLLQDYRDRLTELRQEQEMREDEVDALNHRIEESRRERTAAERQHTADTEEIEGQIKQAEDRLRPVEVDYRTALKKARAAEEDARALGQQIDRARAELHQLSNRSGSGEEVTRLKARVDRWGVERDGLLQEVPKLESRAAELEPEIDRLRKEAERCRQDLRDHRDAGIQAEAEHKREKQRLEGEVERIRIAIENVATARRTLFLECGRQLDIDRPAHDHLEEIYQELDTTAGDIRRIDQEVEIARSKPGPPDWNAVTRAAVVLGGLFLLVILVILAASG